MGYYETEEMSLEAIRRFENFLDREIGTEYERNDSGNGYYLLISDLTPREVDKIRDFENEKLFANTAAQPVMQDSTNPACAALFDEYDQAIREESGGGEISADEYEAALKNILSAPTPNHILVHRFKGRDYVISVADELIDDLEAYIGDVTHKRQSELYSLFMGGFQQYAKEKMDELRKERELHEQFDEEQEFLSSIMRLQKKGGAEDKPSVFVLVSYDIRQNLFTQGGKVDPEHPHIINGISDIHSIFDIPDREETAFMVKMEENV